MIFVLERKDESCREVNFLLSFSNIISIPSFAVILAALLVKKRKEEICKHWSFRMLSGPRCLKETRSSFTRVAVKTLVDCFT